MTGHGQQVSVSLLSPAVRKKIKELVRWAIDHAIWDILIELGKYYWKIATVGGFGFGVYTWLVTHSLLSSLYNALIAFFAGLGVLVSVLIIWDDLIRRFGDKPDAGNGAVPQHISGAGTKLNVLNLHPERSVSPLITYKLKLRIVLRNENAQAVEILALRWETDSDRVQIQPPLAYSFQLEKSNGSWQQDQWQNETRTVCVAPDVTPFFRAA
jgi:hypothetical protein